MSTSRGTGFRQFVFDARDATDSSVVRDNNNFSLTLRPADFGDEPHNASRADILLKPPLPTSRASRSQSVSNQSRSSGKRRPNPGRPNSPSMLNSQIRPSSGEQFRPGQGIYSSFDDGEQRIAFDHSQVTASLSKSNGHYRKHVHQYDKTRGAPLPLPSQMPGQSKYPEQGPLPPVSAVIAGIPPDPQLDIDPYSPIQNKPRTPHEVLGLPEGTPLNLWSLAEPDTPDTKPQYNYHVLVKLAILGNKGQKATLQDILRAIRLRFPYYANLPKQEAIAFSNSIRHLLSLLSAFVREPKPVTEPGKGSYWRVDFSKGEGNKRLRKRNKPQKRTATGQSAGKKTIRGSDGRPDVRSESEDSQFCASTGTPFDSPISQSPGENPPQTPKCRGGGKGGRKAAPKNLMNTPNGGTKTIPSSSTQAAQDSIHDRLDSALEHNVAREYGSISHSSSAPDLYIEAHSSGIGAHRGRLSRGAVRNSPYPSTTVTSRSGSVSSSSEREFQQTFKSPVNMYYQNGHHPGGPPVGRRTPSLHVQQQLHSQQVAHAVGAYTTHGSDAYFRRYTLNNNEGYDSVSSQSPMSEQSTLSPIANTQMHLPIISSSQPQYPSQFPRDNSTISPASATYSSHNHNLAYPAHPLNAATTSNSVPGGSTPASATSNDASYGFMAYADDRQNGSISSSANAMMSSSSASASSSRSLRVQGRHGDSPQYTNFISWNPPRSQAEITGHRH